MSATSNDCAKGSTHLVDSDVEVSEVFEVDVDVLELTSVCESVRGILSTFAFLILSVEFSTLSKVPAEVKLTSAVVSSEVTTVVFVELEVKIKVFVPVLNDGVDGIVGSGINKEPIKTPDSSATNLVSEIVAIALLVCPTNCILFATLP